MRQAVATALLFAGLTAGAAMAQDASQPSAMATPKFIWASLEVSDMAKAHRFYSEALGMKVAVRISKPTDPFQKIGYNFAGSPKAAEPMLILKHYDQPTAEQNHSHGAIIGLIVPDVHAAAARVRRAGYAVLREPPMDAKGTILTAVTADPDGVIVEISQMNGR